MGCCCSSEDKSLDSSITQRTPDYVSEIQRESICSIETETTSITSHTSLQTAENCSRGKRKCPDYFGTSVSKKLCRDLSGANGSGSQVQITQPSGVTESHDPSVSPILSCHININVVPIITVTSDVSSSDLGDVLSNDNNVTIPASTPSSIHPTTLVGNVTPASINRAPLIGNITPTIKAASLVGNVIPKIIVTPASCNKAPLVDNVTPASINNTPLVGNVTSASCNKAPLVDNVTPASNNKASLVGNVTPTSINKAPLIGNVTPTSDNKAPLVGNVTPASNNKAPLVGNVTPAFDNKVPLVGNATPTSINKAPLVGNVTPVFDKKAPLVGSVTPASDNKARFVGNATPTSINKAPLVGNVTPVSDKKAPLVGSVTPASDNKAHLVGNVTPTSINKAPLIGNVTPMSINKAPLVGNVTPVFDKKAPLVGSVTPASDNKARFVGNVNPTSINKAPLIGNVTPTSGNKAPLVGNVTPASNNKAPLVGNVTPASDNKVPLVGNATPTSINKAPLVDNVTPSLGNVALPVVNVTPSVKSPPNKKNSRVNNNSEDPRSFLKQIGCGPQHGRHAKEWRPPACPVMPGVIKFVQRNPNSEYITTPLVSYPHRLLHDPKPQLQYMAPLSTRVFLNNNLTYQPLDDNTQYQVLPPGSVEFQEVVKHFMSTTQSHYRVIHLVKVINKWLLSLYLLKKEEYSIVYGEENVKEKLLFHGTSKVNGESICYNNFNWRCYNNEKKFGHGVNFSTISKYASHYCKDPEPTKVMFAARVLMCNTCDGSSTMLVPPYYNKEKLIRYDTSQKPNGHVQVKFNDDEFYPSYIIYFMHNTNNAIM